MSITCEKTTPSLSPHRPPPQKYGQRSGQAYLQALFLLHFNTLRVLDVKTQKAITGKAEGLREALAAYN